MKEGRLIMKEGRLITKEGANLKTFIFLF